MTESMTVFEAITRRRSIRRFQNKPVPRELIERIMEAAVLAPSGKNLQPWSFVVLEGEKKDRLAAILAQKVAELKRQGEPTGSAQGSARIMAQTPVAILVYDPYWDRRQPLGQPGQTDSNTGNRPLNLVDIQSVGAAIQNLLLAAEACGLGTLWICDILFALEEVGEFVGREHQALIAAVSIGYADESPAPRPRRPWAEVTEWMS